MHPLVRLTTVSNGPLGSDLRHKLIKRQATPAPTKYKSSDVALRCIAAGCRSKRQESSQVYRVECPTRAPQRRIMLTISTPRRKDIVRITMKMLLGISFARAVIFYRSKRLKETSSTALPVYINHPILRLLMFLSKAILFLTSGLILQSIN